MKKGCLIAACLFGLLVSLLCVRLATRPPVRRRHRHRYSGREPPAEAQTQAAADGPRFPEGVPIGESAPGTPLRVPAREAETEPAPDGTLLWEAELANRVTGSFECLGAEGAAGGAALWVRDGTGRNNPDRYYPPSRAHLEDLAARIDSILDADVITTQP